MTIFKKVFLFFFLAIEHELINIVCKYIPSFKQTCSAIIEVGIPDVIKMIREYEDGKKVCTQLGICGTTKKILSMLKKFSIIN